MPDENETETTAPKRTRKPTTVVGTLQRIQKLLEEHTANERAKILAFLTEPTA